MLLFPLKHLNRKKTLTFHTVYGVFRARGFINVFNKKATGFHKQAKRFELTLNENFLEVVKPGGQNRPQPVDLPGAHLPDSHALCFAQAKAKLRT